MELPALSQQIYSAIYETMPDRYFFVTKEQNGFCVWKQTPNNNFEFVEFLIQRDDTIDEARTQALSA